jgi:histone H3/H4
MNDVNETTFYVSDEKHHAPLIESVFELYDEDEIEQNDELRVLVDYLDSDNDEDDDRDSLECDMGRCMISDDVKCDNKSMDSLLASVRREIEIPLIPDLANICMQYYDSFDDIRSSIRDLDEKREEWMRDQVIEDNDDRDRKRWRIEDVEDMNENRKKRREMGEEDVSDDEPVDSSEDEQELEQDNSLVISRDEIDKLIDIRIITEENHSHFSSNVQRARGITDEAVDLLHEAAESYLVDLFKKASELYGKCEIPDGKLMVVSRLL